MIDGASLKEHTLNRLGYGQNRWCAQRYDEIGFDAFVAEQLSGSISGNPRLNGVDPKRRLRRAIVYRRQLDAMLLEFWFNHFNVARHSKYLRDTQLKHQDLIEPHVLGRFRDLLVATARSPAMLEYLDNRYNAKSETVGGRVYGPNENYARELMELHTLGVNGGYAERDVPQVARILTGWTVSGRSFRFDAARHDETEKSALGITFAAGRGEDEGIELLEMLAGQPSTAAFISRKLCERLVSEDPGNDIVAVGASAFEATDGDLREVVRAIVAAPAFRDAAAFRSKVKPPLRYVASAVSAMGATGYPDYRQLDRALKFGIFRLGERPYAVAPPTGDPEASGYWVSGQSMLDRFELAKTIADDSKLRLRLKQASGVDGASVDATVDGVIAAMCPGGVADSTRNGVIEFVSAQGSAANTRISAAAHAVLCCPEFVSF